MRTSNMVGTFPPNDFTSWPAGTYSFMIRGTVGKATDYQDVFITLVDPCPTTQLSIASNPFAGIEHDYFLRDQNLELLYDPNTILSRETLVDCGPATLDFVVGGKDGTIDM